MRQTLGAGASTAAFYSTNGLVGWLLNHIRRQSRTPARLAVLERVTLAPRHSLVLIEAEGRRLLVATSPDGAPVFYSLGAVERGATADSESQRQIAGGALSSRRNAIGRRGNADRRFADARRSSC